MRFHATAPRVVLILALQLTSSLAYIQASAAQQAISYSPERENTDHVRLSTPVVKAWREIPVESPVYALDDAAATKDWLDRALVQQIQYQTGRWRILLEPGYSVFRIYPYMSETNPRPSIRQGIVLKVKGILSVEDLLAAIRNRTATMKIDEYEVFGSGDVNVVRFSRSLFDKPIGLTDDAFFVPGDCVCGSLVSRTSSMTSARVRLVLYHHTARFVKHVSQLYGVDKNVKSIVVKRDGSFDFGKLKPGYYQIEADSNRTRAFQILPPSGKRSCGLRLTRSGDKLELTMSSEAD